jgi:hypothetical protein
MRDFAYVTNVSARTYLTVAVLFEDDLSFFTKPRLSEEPA